MDPHTGTIYTLKGGKATVLTTEANIVMDDPNALNLPTQTAKVVPDPLLVSKDSDGTVNDSSLPDKAPETETNTVDTHLQDSSVVNEKQTTQTEVTQPTGPSETSVSTSAAKPTSPNPMKPPSGDITKLPDVVSSTVSSEGTKTSDTVTCSTAAPILPQTINSTATSTESTPKKKVTFQETPVTESGPKQTTNPAQIIPQPAVKPPVPSPKSPTQKTVYKCELCEYRSTQKPDVYQHLLKVHTPSKMMMCAKCKKG